MMIGGAGAGGGSNGGGAIAAMRTITIGYRMSRRVFGAACASG